MFFCRWIQACINEELPPTTELEEGLRNGVYLAQLGHFLAPQVVPLKKIYDKDQSRYQVRQIKIQLIEFPHYILWNEIYIYVNILSFWKKKWFRNKYIWFFNSSAVKLLSGFYFWIVLKIFIVDLRNDFTIVSLQSRGLHFRHTDNINHWFVAMEKVGLPQVKFSIFPLSLNLTNKKFHFS